MKTGSRTTNTPRATRATSVESVRFRDGDIVTADDLDAAMRYSASLLHVVLRSYLGCGVVCGLELTLEEEGRGDCDRVLVHIGPGLVIDCHGYPVELCGGLELVLRRDCTCEGGSQVFDIVVRRSTSDEVSAQVCGCGAPRHPELCNRERDHVVVAAIPADCELGEHSICRRPDPPVDRDPGCYGSEASGSVDTGTPERPGRGTVADRLCDCLTACPDDRCCGESWVLLGSLTIREGGEALLDSSRRRYVKPIECRCGPGRDQDDEGSKDEVRDRLADMERRLKAIEGASEDTRS